MCISYLLNFCIKKKLSHKRWHRYFFENLEREIKFVLCIRQNIYINNFIEVRVF